MSQLIDDIVEELGWTTTPPPPVMDVGWEAYYGVVLWSALMQGISLLALAWAALAAWRRRVRCPDGEGLRVREPVDVVVPCFLPNEEPIIQGTVRHLLEGLRGVDDLTVHLVYNTPKDMPEAEAELRALEKECARPGRRLIVQRVEGSKSKAENLNRVLPQLKAPFTAIYDADHHPDADSLALAVWHLKGTGCDCVQGSTYIRTGCLPARLLICAEFFVNYFVVLPAMQAIAGTGFFGGANGIWRTSSIQQIRFDEAALTEDIDCFARAITEHGFHFEFLPESCSGELLPNGLRAIWRQRLRWAMGWDQVTLKHAAKFWGPQLSLRRRAGLCYIFFCRWLTQTCALLIVVLNARAAIQWELAKALEDASPDGLQVPECVAELQILSFYGYCLFISYSVVRALAHRPLRLLPGLCLYFALMPAIVMFNSVLLLVSLFRVTTGSTGGWVVTTRAHGAKTSTRSSEVAAIALAPSSFSIKSLEEPLLEPPPRDGVEELQGRRTAACVLGAALGTSGALGGVVVGLFAGQRTVVEPLWGWVPFGIGAKTTTVTDGRVVAACMATGVALAMVAFWVALWMREQGERRKESQAMALERGAAPGAAVDAAAAALSAAETRSQ